MAWWTFAFLAVVASGAVVLSGGALLWAGARFLARLDEATFGRCLGVYIFAGVVAVLGYFAVTHIVFALLVGPYGVIPGRIVGAALALAGFLWAVKKAMGSSYRGAGLSALPLLGQAGLAFLVGSVAAALVRGPEARAACRCSLVHLGPALNRYAEHHDGRLPRDLSALRADLGDEWAMPRCPAAPDRPDGGYFYFAGAGPNNVDIAEPGFRRRLLACDLLPHHGGRNVLTGDGWARWLSEADFQAALAEPRNADFTQALRAAAP